MVDCQFGRRKKGNCSASVFNNATLGLDGVLAEREVGVLLLLLDGLDGGLVLGETATDGAGLLDAEVQGQEVLLLVEETELGALSLGDHGHDASNRLADSRAKKHKG